MAKPMKTLELHYPVIQFLIISVIILCDFFFLSIGRESTTWPANNCLQIMVCSCVVPSKTCFAANDILLMRNWNNVLKRKMADRFPELPGSENKLGDRMIKSVITKYHDLAVCRRSIICLSLRLRQIYWSARHWQIMIFCSTSSNNS